MKKDREEFLIKISIYRSLLSCRASPAWGLQSIWNVTHNQSKANHSLDRDSVRNEPFIAANTFLLASHFYYRIPNIAHNVPTIFSLMYPL